MARSQDAPVNAASAPWAHTAQGHGNPAQHHLLHDGIQHPNPLHLGRQPVSPFAESMHAPNGWAGRARHWPEFSSTGGLSGGTRK